jgi:hypothetical protein
MTTLAPGMTTLDSPVKPANDRHNKNTRRVDALRVNIYLIKMKAIYAKPIRTCMEAPPPPLAYYSSLSDSQPFALLRFSLWLPTVPHNINVGFAHSYVRFAPYAVRFSITE